MGTQRVLVIFPACTDTSEVEQFRTRWDPLAAEVAGHITIVFPFTSRATDQQLHQLIAEVAARHTVFPVEFADPVIWQNEYLFLLPRRGREQIHRLHQDLYAALPDARLEDEFVAHMTIGRSSAARDLGEAWRIATTRALTLGGYATHLSVYRVGEDGGRPIAFVVPLQGAV